MMLKKRAILSCSSHRGLNRYISNQTITALDSTQCIDSRSASGAWYVLGRTCSAPATIYRLSRHSIPLDHHLASAPCKVPLAPSIRVIPKDAGVDIDGVGIRYADDSGSKIIGFHVDNFLGEVQAVVTT
jgi:3D (Asp-Asp-Asp) domain-containing protein